MNGKKLLWMTVAFLAVVGIIVLGNKLSAPKQAGKSLRFFSTFSEANCSSVLLVGGTDSVRIKRKGEIWVVAGEPSAAANEPAAAGPLGANKPATGPSLKKDYPADSASVQTMFEKLGSMSRTELISQNPDKQSTFEVDSAHGTYAEVFDDKGASLGSLRIGKNGADWSTTFVRAIGSNDVYLVGNNVKNAFFADRKRWRDKKIMQFDRAAVEKLVFAKQGGNMISLAAKKADTTANAAVEWRFASPDTGKAKTDVVNDALGAGANLLAGDWEEDASISDSAMGFIKPELILTISLKGAITKQLVVGRKKESVNKFWVRTPDMPGTTFLVDDYTIAKFDKNVNGLRGIEEKKKEDAKKPGQKPPMSMKPAPKALKKK
jgi:hypothetical protein